MWWAACGRPSAHFQKGSDHVPVEQVVAYEDIIELWRFSRFQYISSIVITLHSSDACFCKNGPSRVGRNCGYKFNRCCIQSLCWTFLSWCLWMKVLCKLIFEANWTTAQWPSSIACRNLWSMCTKHCLWSRPDRDCSELAVKDPPPSCACSGRSSGSPSGSAPGRTLSGFWKKVLRLGPSIMSKIRFLPF